MLLPNAPILFLACAQEKKQRGVLLAIRNSLTFRLKDFILDTEGHYIILIYDINAQPYIPVALYAPNSHQLRFLQNLFKRISSIKYGHLLMCGDFKLTVNPRLDTTYPASGRISSLCNLLHLEEVYDIWRCQHASARDYMYFSARHQSYSHIDRPLCHGQMVTTTSVSLKSS